MSTKLKYWIKERYNPQIGTYYVAMGQMSKTKAKKWEKTLYGDNEMHSFNTEAEYNTRLEQLRKNGERVETQITTYEHKTRKTH